MLTITSFISLASNSQIQSLTLALFPHIILGEPPLPFVIYVLDLYEVFEFMHRVAVPIKYVLMDRSNFLS